MANTPIQRVTYSHEALINWMVENPDRPLRDAAAYFGYSQGWLSCIIHSDVFQAKLARRQEEVFAQIAQDIPSRLRGAADLALNGLTEKLENGNPDAKFLLDATDKLLHRMGYAPASARNPLGTAQVVQNNTQINNYTVNASDLAAARALAKQRDLPALPMPTLAEPVPTGQEVRGSAQEVHGLPSDLEGMLNVPAR